MMDLKLLLKGALALFFTLVVVFLLVRITSGCVSTTQLRRNYIQECAKTHTPIQCAKKSLEVYPLPSGGPS